MNKFSLYKLRLQTSEETTAVLNKLSQQCRTVYELSTTIQQQQSLISTKQLMNALIQQTPNLKHLPSSLFMRTTRLALGKKINPQTSWFPISYGEDASAYQLERDNLRLAVFQTENQQLLFINLPLIDKLPQQGAQKTRDVTISREQQQFYVSIHFEPLTPEIIREDTSKLSDQLRENEQAQYELLTDISYGHQQFGEVQFPNQKGPHSIGTKPPPHPLLANEAYFSGIDDNVNPLPDMNTESQEQYAELKHELAPATQPTARATSTPKPKPM